MHQSANICQHDPGEHLAASLGPLINASFARLSKADSGTCAETYHSLRDTIREATPAGVAPRIQCFFA